MKLAICIPTYQASSMLEELIVRCMNTYISYGIDVYIYDSSEDDLTYKMISKMGNKNIFYQRIDSKIESNMKVIRIFQDMQESVYDYIWLCPDYFHLLENGIKHVSPLLDGKNDFIILNYRDVQELGDCVWNDYNDVFRNLAWHMTSYMSTIVNRKSVLFDIDWSYFINKYCQNETIYFSHLGLYLERMCKMSTLNVWHLTMREDEISASTLRTGSKWIKDTFKVWAKGWPTFIDLLPDKYVSKSYVKKTISKYAGILSYKNMVGLRASGIYDSQVYKQYQPGIKEVSNVPIGLCKILSYVSPGIVQYRPKWTVKEWFIYQRLHRFGRKYKRIYIYGCGALGAYASELLERGGDAIVGYIVSSPDNEKKIYRDKEVIGYSKSLFDENVGIILALNNSNANVVLRDIIEEEYHKHTLRLVKRRKK